MHMRVVYFSNQQSQTEACLDLADGVRWATWQP